MDLFSGIGGFAEALKGRTQVDVFCEIDPDCQKVLKKHHPKNTLILDDVNLIDKKTVSNHDVFKNVEMITAGFPCTDISIANIKGRGLEGEFSGLFHEILRILDILPNIKFLFLENSPQIRLRGLDVVLAEFKKRGFSCFWTYINASDVGALHKRRRWYCFCFKSCISYLDLKSTISKIKQVSIKKNITNHDWNDNKNINRIIEKATLTQDEKETKIKRCRMLGNSIVPQCAAYAWNILTTQLEHLPSNSSVYKNKDFIIQQEIPVDIIFPQNRHYLEFDDGKTKFTKDRWATPNYSFWHMFRAISSLRCKTTFMVQLLFEKNTKVKRGENKSTVFNKYIADTFFIEHLFGYKKNWTQF
jgi:DNA (cytosine-5)-methyltransferase 1